MPLELPDCGSFVSVDTISDILATWEAVVAKEQLPKAADSNYIFAFRRLAEFDMKCSPLLRSFAREKRIRGLSLQDIDDGDISRQIVAAILPFFNVSFVSIEKCNLAEAETTFPMILRRIPTSLCGLRLGNITMSTEVLNEWSSLSASPSRKHSLKQLNLHNVSFGGDVNESYKKVALILKNTSGLESLSLEPRRAVQISKPVLRKLCKSIGGLGALESLTIAGVDLSDSLAFDYLIAGRAVKLRKSLEHLSLPSCSLTRLSVDKLTNRPLLSLSKVDVSGNTGLDASSVALLKGTSYLEVLGDFDSDVSDQLSNSSSEDEKHLYWDETQQN